MIGVTPELREALNALAVAEKGVTDIGLRQDDGRKADLVRGRRALAEQMGLVGRIIEADQDLAQHADARAAMIEYFSGLRFGLALHQANWPAVRLDEDPDAYRSSVRAVRERSDVFWDWCRSHIAFSCTV